MKDLHLKRFEANSFMGISADDPIVIEFPKGKPVTLLKGNQGTKKTSTLTALMHMMGAAFAFDTSTFVNNTDETVDVELKFVYEGTEYIAAQSGSRISLKRFYKEADKFVQESSPKETLRRIFGNLGVSPMFLKNLDGTKQIDWFKKTFGDDEEATKKEVKLKKDLKNAEESRKSANRDKKNLAGWLAESKLAQNYEANQKKFKEAVSIEKEQEKYSVAEKKKTQYQDYANKVKSSEELAALKRQEIADMEKSLADAKDQLQKLNTSLETGNKWLTENKNVEKEYEVARTEFLNASKKVEEYKDWKEVVRKKKEHDEFEDASTQLTGQIDDLRYKLRELTKKYLPEVEGLEIRLASGIDDEDQDEGIYYHDKTLAQLSESELWDLFLLIWEQMEVQFIFCENINALGSDAIKTLNRLAKEKKAQIFASEMDRKKNHIEISLSTKLD